MAHAPLLERWPQLSFHTRSSDKASLGAERTRARGTFSGRGLHPKGFPSVNEAPRRKLQRSLWSSSWEGRGPRRAARIVHSELQETTTPWAPGELPESHCEAEGGKRACEHVSFQPRGGGALAPFPALPGTGLGRTFLAGWIPWMLLMPGGPAACMWAPTAGCWGCWRAPLVSVTLRAGCCLTSGG